MLEQKGKYNPKVYGELRSEFLESLDTIPSLPIETREETQEKLRQKIIQEIKEGKLVHSR